MKNFKGKDGIVSVRIKGEWQEIGRCGIVYVEDEGGDDDERMKQAQEIAQEMIGDEMNLVSMTRGVGDIEDMHEFVYYSWLHSQFPTLVWN